MGQPGRLLWPLLIFMLSACSGSGVVSNPRLADPLPPVVDTLLVDPFRNQNASGLTIGDLNFFQDTLVAELVGRKKYKNPVSLKIKNPNVAHLEGEITRFAILELQGEGIFVRQVNITATVSFRQPYTQPEPPPIQITRGISYQIGFHLPAGRKRGGVATDVHGAIEELSHIFTEAFAPQESAEDIFLADMQDPDTGEMLGKPELLRGNLLAQNGDFDQAVRKWLLTLYNPQPEKTHEYRVNRWAVTEMKKAGVDQTTLAQLEPMMDQPPMEFADFREELKDHLGQDHPLLAEITKSCELEPYLMHGNMAAAHLNLAAFRRLTRQVDMEAYHLAMGYAHFPQKKVLEKWRKLQISRGQLTEEEPAEPALRFFLKLPAPTTLKLSRGNLENSWVEAPLLRSARVEPAGQMIPQPVKKPSGEAASGAAVTGERDIYSEGFPAEEIETAPGGPGGTPSTPLNPPPPPSDDGDLSPESPEMGNGGETNGPDFKAPADPQQPSDGDFPPVESLEDESPSPSAPESDIEYP
ncbi:MAG: hypothetical protein OEW12_01010 [Deltaproteobacteria bacterium]|nr:hypothetical protein [Deltaproteobacteria bacterium]